MSEDRPTQTSEPVPAPKKRRWRRRLLYVFGLIVLLVALLPRLASSGAGNDVVVALANGSLQGRLALEDLSLRWFGPCRVRGLQLYDTREREVLRAEDVDLRQGVLSLLVFGPAQAEIRQLYSYIYVSDRNEISLLQALNRSAELTEETDPGGDVRAFTVTGDRIIAERRNGDIHLQSEQPIVARRMLEGSEQPQELISIARFDLTQDGDTYSLNADLVAPQTTGSARRHAALRATIQPDPKDMSGRVELSGDIGTLLAEISYRPNETDELKVDELITAALGRGDVRLPDLTLSSTADVDLAAVLRTVPGLFDLRGNVELTGGRLKIDSLQLEGGQEPTLKGNLELAGLTADTPEGRVQIATVSAQFDASLEREEGLVFRAMEVASPFAQLSASGPARSMQARWRADLSELHRQLDQVFDLEGWRMAGTIEGNISVAQQQEDRVGLEAALDTQGLHFAKGEQVVEVQDGKLNHTGYFTFQDGRVSRWVIDSSRASLDDALIGQATGWYDFKSGAFESQLSAQNVDVSYATKLARRLGANVLEGYEGQIKMNAALRRDKTNAALLSSGSLTASALRRNGQMLSDGDTRVDWSDFRYQPAEQSIRAEKIEVNSDMITALASFEYVPGERQLPAWNDLTQAVLAAEPLRLPELNVHARGRAHLGSVRHLLPSHVQEQIHADLEKSAVNIEALQLSGGEQPQLLGRVLLSGVALGDEESPEILPDVNLDVDVAFEQSSGWVCRRAELKSESIHFEASGQGGELAARLQGDFGQYRQFARIMALDIPALEGALSSQIKLSGIDEQGAGVQIEASVDQAVYQGAEQSIRFDRIHLTHMGRIDFADGVLQRLSAEKFALTADQEVSVHADGWYDLKEGTFSANVDAPRTDLALLTEQLAVWDIAELPGYSGSLLVQANFSRKSPEGAMLTSGHARFEELKRNQQRLGDGRLAVQWSDLSLSPDTLDAKLIKLDSEMARLNMTNARASLGEQPAFAGHVDGDMNLKPCTEILGSVKVWAENFPLAGRLRFQSECSMSAGTVRITAAGDISDLAIGRGEHTFVENRAGFSYQGDYIPKQQRLTLKALNLNSQALTASATGQISDLGASVLADLEGQYETNWDQTTRIMHNLFPQTSELLALKGPNKGGFTLKGPLSDPEGRLVSPRLTAQTDVSFASAELLGLQLQRASITPVLRQARLQIPVTAIETRGGMVQLGGVLDLTTEQPVLNLPGTAQLLRNVEITPELADAILSRINPLFLHMASAQGHVSLTTRDIALPLGAQILSAGSGTGHLDLTQIEARPQGVLAELLVLLGMGTAQQQRKIDVSGLDFEIRKGRIYFDKFKMVFAKEYDLVFRGSVGLDESLDMSVSIPVRGPLLDRLGVPSFRGALAGLEGLRVDVPIVGTRKQPRLDLSDIDLSGVLQPEGILRSIDELLKPKDQGGSERQPRRSPKRRDNR